MKIKAGQEGDMPKMIERLQFEVDRFELYTGLRPTRLVVAPDVLKAYCDELGLLMAPSWGLPRAEFNGYPVEPDPKLPAGVVLVDSDRGPMYPLPPPKRAALSAPPAGDPEASPRPWRITDSDPCIIHDANGGLVAALWSRVRGEGRGRADAALIVGAVNAAWEGEIVGRHPSKVHAHREGKFYTLDGPPTPGVTPLCALPLGHSGPCVPETSVRPGPFSGVEVEHVEHVHRTDCALPATHSGPCIAAGFACALSDHCDGREGHIGPCQPAPRCQRDPVCDQRAGHEGPCRYEFPAGPPKLPAGLADPPRGCVPGCIRSLGHDGSCVPPAAPASTCVPSCALAVGHPGPCFGPSPLEDARATLSADCARPLEHAPGCECSRLA